MEPGFASNRRRSDGPVDTGIPVLRFESVEGSTIAILVSYACHPVVLSADNLSWTGDYPHFVRKKLETKFPGAIAIFATGCAGDVNTGHSAAASLSLSSSPKRSFARAKEIGIWHCEVSYRGASSSMCQAMSVIVKLFGDICFEQREHGAPDILAKSWRLAAKDTGSIEAIWANWAEKHMGRDLSPLRARITALKWGRVAGSLHFRAKSLLKLLCRSEKSSPKKIHCSFWPMPMTTPATSHRKVTTCAVAMRLTKHIAFMDWGPLLRPRQRSI